ncbi:MAG: hypothetical protein JSR60_14425 [Proteobacteria bacterium]|nr:hypothetical protein [Pseudomonadota bacterium]
MSALGEQEIAREARRVFRSLDHEGAFLMPDGKGGHCVVRRTGRGKQTGAVVAAPLIEAFRRRGWLVRAGAADCFVLSDAGQGWIRRAFAQDDAFAAQHQLRRRRRREIEGREQTVTLNEGESPLARLKTRGLIDGVQFDAGEKLRVDFTLAGLTPRLGVDLSAPLLTGSRAAPSRQMLSDTVLAAKQRFTQAMRAVGPGLNTLLFDICCHLRGLEEAEAARAWPSRSARVVLAIALERLAQHYGMRVTGTTRLRGWQMEGGE